MDEPIHLTPPIFKVNLADSRSLLSIEQIDLLWNVLRTNRPFHSFEIVVTVALPDHLRAIWALPEDDADFPLRRSLINSAFSRSMSNTETIRANRKM
jgi:putative transposase